MHYSRTELQTICSFFEIQDSIVDTYTFLDYTGTDEVGTKEKLILRLDFAQRKSVVMKLTKEKFTQSIIQQQCEFSEKLRKAGILTAQKFLCSDGYCLCWNGVHIIVEEYLTGTLEKINKTNAVKIGQLLAKMHLLSESHHYHLPIQTIFDFMGHNEVNGFDSFTKLMKDFDIAKEIIALYQEKAMACKKLWQYLPTYAVQGDFTLNNLAISDG